MFLRTNNYLLAIMVASLAFLGLVRALTIDNQLTVIKNDCYERMAIGQRLAPKDVYKTADIKTVPECQMACTKEEALCKAFSFGIAVKGNATCELGHNEIKETAALKPIGTLADTDFDLYIKKHDCKLVIENSAPFQQVTELPHQIVTRDPYNNPQNQVNSENIQRPQDNSEKPSNDYLPNSIKPNYDKPSQQIVDDDIHHVQTLVSISTGPQKPVLHPVHDILVGAEAYYNNPNKPNYDDANRPPFRPPMLNHPYDEDWSRPPQRPPTSDGYGSKPHSNGYDDMSRPPQRPPAPDDYESEPHSNGYDNLSRPPQRLPTPNGYENKPHLDDYHDSTRPLQRPPAPDGYASKPHLNEYDDSPRPFQRPHHSQYENKPDLDKYDRPFLDEFPRPYLPGGYGNNADLDKYDRPSINNRPYFDGYYYPKPDFDAGYGPIPERYGSYISHPDYYNKPNPVKNDYLFDQHLADRYDYQPKPSGGYGNIENGNYTKPNSSPPSYGNSNQVVTDRPSYWDSGKPTETYSDKTERPKNPAKPNKGSYYGTTDNKPSYNSDNNIKDEYPPKQPQNSKPIISQSIGNYGQPILSIITEIKEPCFRRVLAGKRVARGFVKRALICERIDDCQRECADEKYFQCEGFNYRLDPTGRGKGECELLDLPLSHLDIGRDLYPDPDYDYYERDRNAASVNCKQRPNGYLPPANNENYYHQSGHGGNYNHGYDNYYYNRRPVNSWNDRWPDDEISYGNRRPDFNRRPSYDDKYRPHRYDYYDGQLSNGNRRGDFSYHESHNSQHNYENSHNYHYNYHNSDRDDYNHQNHYHGIHYLPPNRIDRPLYQQRPYDDKSYEPYLPPNRRYDRPYDDKIVIKYYIDREHDKNYWGLKNNFDWYGGNFGNTNSVYDNNNDRYYSGLDNRKNYYLPSKVGGTKDWGQYGGTYGNGGFNLQYNGYGQTTDYWGLNKYDDKYHGGQSLYNDLPPYKKPAIGGDYLQPPKHPHFGHSYAQDHNFNKNYYNSLLPAEPRLPSYNYLKDECSLRTATGFKLHKGIVKRFFSVPNIYECELLCFREKHFRCASYAFRYTISFSTPSDNCFLSNRNYKELDFYTDLQPDRDFDIYTMNNQERCEQPVLVGKDNSDCFWRVRSGQRLDHKVVRDSLIAQSIVECQLECLRSKRFTCRAFSYRYGSPIVRGALDNCLLTDWPYFELDPRIHFVPEPGFEVYERGSFGHGCETDHFGIRGHNGKDHAYKTDELCYVGFGSPARLLSQATKKLLSVETESDCKTECSKLKEGTLFQCMSFSYTNTPRKGVPNCRLSDILQRDLLPIVDYAYDPDSWLFAWNNYNPECVALANEPIHHNHIGTEHRVQYHDFYALDTWRVYSVSGWPCRRGTLCHENREAGFWFCELEGGDANTWDYCCRPDHHCGYSEGFSYQWCYVGPAKTQWRKCSDRYYPYVHNVIDRIDYFQGKPYLPPQNYLNNNKQPWLPPTGNYIYEARPPPGLRPGIHPERPPAPPLERPPQPSLDEYEMQFDNQFLDPPRPGGFIQSRHWPVSYLHKVMPPNNSDSESRLIKTSRSKESNPKYAAIQNLIDIIKSNDLKNVQYQITNESNREDDILFVKIPLPTNFTQATRSGNLKTLDSVNSSVSNPIDIEDEKTNRKRSQKSLPVTLLTDKIGDDDSFNENRFLTGYRRSYITRTNVTSHAKRGRIERTFI